jgi:hypothetical protein
MNLFRKNKTENWVIKLFKITDKKIAENFDMEKCILLTIDSISQFSDLKATDFDINYKDSKKTLNGFKKALKKHNEIVYSFVGFGSNKTNTYFTLNNPMLNWNEKPEKSSIDISIQIASEFVELNSIEQIAEKLIKSFDFEYGYITKLPSNYDSGTEGKIRKSLFTTRVESNQFENIWTFHLVGILEGFIKRIYQINYLNKSHFSELETKQLILKYGNKEKISEKISKWTLSLDEIKSLENNEQIRKISIITTKLEFLKNEKAKNFKRKMELKKA